MPLEALFARYRAAGYAAAAAGAGPAADEQIYLALLAAGERDWLAAERHAALAAAAQPGELVYAACAEYLARVRAAGQQGVYVAPEAFGAFIRGGGNLPLYQAVSAALRQAHQAAGARSLLDIGVGDGLALLPALTDAIERVDLVEPSAALLTIASQQLMARSVPHQAFQGTLQEFVARADDRWDVAEATFSLQSIEPAERVPLLAWLRAHCGRLLIAEFDTPAFADMYAPERVRYVLERFGQGLAEYAGDGGLVAQGFLMPVMFGYFDRTAARTNYEHPLAEWQAQLQAAGFTQIAARQLYPYWWAPAFLLEASA